MELDFLRIEYDIKFNDPIEITALLYDTIRTYREHFKYSCCQTTDTNCSSCQIKASCPYAAIFNQNLSTDPEIVKIHQKPSLPFILNIYEASDSYKTYTLSLVIIGYAVNHLALFHTSLLNMLKSALSNSHNSSSYTINAYAIDYQNDRHSIKQCNLLDENIIMLSAMQILQNTVHSENIRLILRSPLRLLSNGSEIHRFDFAAFFRSQLRRCSSLLAYYGSGRLDIDFISLSESTRTVKLFNDKIKFTHPNWTTKMSKNGLIGSTECRGLLQQMLPILLLGSYFNAGKNATYGMGFHKIEVI